MATGCQHFRVLLQRESDSSNNVVVLQCIATFACMCVPDLPMSRQLYVDLFKLYTHTLKSRPLQLQQLMRLLLSLKTRRRLYVQQKFRSLDQVSLTTIEEVE